MTSKQNDGDSTASTTARPKRAALFGRAVVLAVEIAVDSAILRSVVKKSEDTPTAIRTVLALYSPSPTSESTPVPGRPHTKRRRALEFSRHRLTPVLSNTRPDPRTPNKQPQPQLINFNKDLNIAEQAAARAEQSSGGGCYKVKGANRKTPVKKRITACKGCGAPVDRKFKYCPNCGLPLTNRQDRY
ncbi:hypothetical protein Bbelb_342680 [Branchiostoma belcheri]|nr:hypothetical protein Bbelb_342680 [Branchiostoma belcheri]